VNCAECQTDPLTPGHYCPCCGRKLSLQEQRAVEATLPPTRCLSCGGLSVNGDLCKSCKEAYAPVLASATVTAPSHEPTPAAVQKAAALDLTTEVMLPPQVVNMDETKMAAAKAAADLTAKAHLAKAANQAPVTRRPIVPVPPPTQSRSRTPMLMMAAAVIVGAIGAAEGARRFGFDWPLRDAPEASPVQATAAVESVPPAERRVLPRDTPSAAKVVTETKPVTANRPSAIAPSRGAARPKPSTAAARRVPVRQGNPPAQQVVPVVASTPAPEIPAPAPARPAAAESARPSAPLTGKFFESNDVDDPPRVATRVGPRLPANVPAGADKKIVVARVLVSSTGHPHHVTLLRGSMLGSATDEAVVAAVTQWRFSPAKKRGEPVNCWLNIGVPLGQAQ
jgi:protein TonB